MPRSDRRDRAGVAGGLRSLRVVDLTHPLHHAIPCWPGDPPLTLEPWASHAEHGYFIQRLGLGEHTGTHVGSPNTFLAGGRAIADYAADELVGPAVVVDVSAQAAGDADHVITADELLGWEDTHGRIPDGAFILAHTGWDRFWNAGTAAFLGLAADGRMHTPGFGPEAMTFLTRERGIRGAGIDTHGIDPGLDTGLRASRILAGHGGLALQCLRSLGQLLGATCLLLVGALPIEGGSGSPARVVAMVEA